MKQNITLILLVTISFLAFSREGFTFDNDLKFAQVEYVKLSEKSNGTWTFDVSVLHDDSGWDHYADLWIVVDSETEEILSSRVLAHPHETEQPFTRSLSGVRISENTRYVEVRAKCNLHDFEGQRVRIDFENGKSETYEIKFYK